MAPLPTGAFCTISTRMRPVRGEAMQAVMADPRMRPDTNPMPFDGKRMIFGGVEVLIEK
jgi:uncharacterized protein YbaA (DUF1428 family)